MRGYAVVCLCESMSEYEGEKGERAMMAFIHCHVPCPNVLSRLTWSKRYILVPVALLAVARRGAAQKNCPVRHENTEGFLLQNVHLGHRFERLAQGVRAAAQIRNSAPRNKFHIEAISRECDNTNTVHLTVEYDSTPQYFSLGIRRDGMKARTAPSSPTTLPPQAISFSMKLFRTE